MNKKGIVNAKWFFYTCEKRNGIQSAMDSVTVYQQIVSSMFEDGLINTGRLVVLYRFTKQYCEQVPDKAQEIWNIYNRLIQWNNEKMNQSTNRNFDE